MMPSFGVEFMTLALAAPRIVGAVEKMTVVNKVKVTVTGYRRSNMGEA